MSPFARKRARKVLSATLFAGIIVASSGVLLILEAESADAAGPISVTILSPATGTYSYSTDTTFRGIATPGEAITVTTTQGPGCTALADASDNWSCDVDGLTTSESITATATGNFTDAPPNLDTSTFSLVWIPNINGTIGQRITSSDPQPTLTGTADPGAVVNVGLNSSSCSTTADGSGKWSCTISPALPDAAGYGDPVFGLLADQTPTWAGGRTSDYIADTYKLLRPLPDPAFSSPVNTSGGARTAHLTNTSPTLVGTAEPNANVNVTYGLDGFPSSGGYCAVVADASGNFTCPFSGGTAMTVGNKYYVRAEQIDTVHPSSLGATNLFFMDFINPPSIPTISTPAGGYTNSHPTVLVSGSADDGDIVHAVIDGVRACASVVVGGTWRCRTRALAPGPHTLSAYAADRYGNRSGSAVEHTLTILPPPAAPSISSPSNGYESSQPTLTATGAGVDGTSIHVTLDASDACDTVVLAGAWTCDFGSVGPGQHALGAFATDSYGTNSASAPSRTITILDGPAPPQIVAPTNLYESSKRPLTVSGSSATGVTVQVLIDGTNACVALVSGAQWSCQVSSVAIGAHSVTAVATDAYESSSGETEPVTITILAPPSAPSISTPTDGLKTIARTLAVVGTSGPGMTVGVVIDGASACTTTATEDGSWSCSTAKLALGIHTISAVATDPYGTTSSPSSTESFTISTPAGDVIPATAGPTPTPAPTVAPTPDPTSSPVDSPLAITGNKQKPHAAHPAHPAPAAPAQTLDSPTTFSTSLHSITETKITALGAAVSGGVAGGFVLFVAFPAELLKNTIRENYESAFRWLAPTRRWFAGVKRRAKRVKINPWLGGSVIILIAALLLGFAEPGFGFNGSSVRLWFALVLSLAGVNVIVPAVTGIVSRRAFSAPMSLRPLPAALILVLVSAVISRIGHIEPGFLFAGVLGVTFGAELGRRRSGILAIVSVGVTVILGLGSWLAYSAIAPIAQAHPSFWNLLWSEVLSAMTIELLATLVISLLPLRFLDGAAIFAWKKWAWAVAYFGAVLILIFVIAPISDNWGPESAPLLGWGVFFVAFALVAVGIWALFRLRSGQGPRAPE
ncbi:MAG TPA: Ig-like domain-containing protein [Galbitalea sp.]|nr:Ig-like domain-containing protein [Galbitalea sp.]